MLSANASLVPNLSGAEKAASLFLIMGKDVAVKLAEQLSREELKRLVDAAGSLPELSAEMLDQLVQEFGANYMNRGAVMSPAELSSVVGMEKASVEKPAKTPSARPAPASDANVEFDAERIVAFFENEQPAISAILLDTIGEKLAADTLAGVDPALRNQIFEAYVNRKALDPAVEGMFQEELLATIQKRDSDGEGSAKAEKAAGFLNFFPDEMVDGLMAHFEAQNPELAATMKASLFKFASVPSLSKEARSLVFDGVQSEEMVRALIGADDKMKESVLEVISQRNRRLVESELAQANAEQEEIDATRRQIAAIVVRLAKEGRIALPDAEAGR